MSSFDEVKRITDASAVFRETLFAQGYLFTSANVDTEAFPFYGAWQKACVSGYFLLTHPRTKHFVYQTAEETLLLIGHAYDPFDGIWHEDELLRRYAEAQDKTGYLNEWTGLFALLVIRESSVEVWGDCAGMQAAYYGVLKDGFFLSSHAQLIGDVCGLAQSQYARRLKHYRFWSLYGISLPGNLSPFENVFRLVPNHSLTVYAREKRCVLSRFYPAKDLKMVKNSQEYDEIIQEIGNILHRTLELISQKWNAPAISMTGGMDSKTTVACANGLLDRFRYFSYVSASGEEPDAQAAKTIAEAIGVKHKIYNISEKDDDFPELSSMQAVIEHNLGDMGSIHPNDVRKRLYFLNTQDFDVEVKSWVSEIGRANYYKRYGVKRMPRRLSPRQMTSMYKFFAYNRATARETDRIFRAYIEKARCNDIFNLDSTDLYQWELREGAWGGLTITSEHRVSYDITIPYNNRRLMELFLRLPLEKRLVDTPHFDVIRTMNAEIDRLGITVSHYHGGKLRRYCEKAYFFLHSLLPF